MKYYLDTPPIMSLIFSFIRIDKASKNAMWMALQKEITDCKKYISLRKIKAELSSNMVLPISLAYEQHAK